MLAAKTTRRRLIFHETSRTGAAREISHVRVPGAEDEAGADDT